MALPSSFKLFSVERLLLLLLFALFVTSESTQGQSHGSSEMEKFDDVMKMLMPYAKVPGAQLAVAKDGHLKYFKAFGIANLQNAELLTTQHVMRYNSISKVFTGVAILKLIQEGRLNLEDKPFGFLDDLPLPKGATMDPRLFNITVQHLLQHTAGWNETSGVNVEILPTALYASQALGRPAPPTTYEGIRYMKGVPLDFDPGSAMEYSALGYQVLGRVVEKVTGMNYADYMQQHMFIPLGLTGMKLAESQVERLAHNEVRYHGFDGEDQLVLSIFPGEGYVNASYGIVDYRALDSGAGWTGNAADAVTFMDHIDGLRWPAILNPEMVHTMLNAPMPSNRSLAGNRYFDHSRGLNVFVSVDQNGKVKSFQHGGANYGAMSYVMRIIDKNITFAFQLNTCAVGDWVYNAIGNLTEVAYSIQDWPHGDLVFKAT